MRDIMCGDYTRDYARYYARLNLTVTTDVCSIGWLSRAMMCVDKGGVGLLDRRSSCNYYARPTQQFYYARRFCVPRVKTAQIMRDIMRDSISFTCYYARNAWRYRNDRGLAL